MLLSSFVRCDHHPGLLVYGVLIARGACLKERERDIEGEENTGSRSFSHYNGPHPHHNDDHPHNYGDPIINDDRPHHGTWCSYSKVGVSW